MQYTLQNVNDTNLNLENDGELKDHLEQIAGFSMLHYSDIMSELQGELTGLMGGFEGQRGVQDQIGWILLISGSLVGLKEKRVSDSNANLDSQLINLVFSLISKMPNNLSNSIIFEASLLHFFQALTKSYFNSPNDTSWFFYHKTENAQQQVSKETLGQVLAIIIEKVVFIIGNNVNRKLVTWALEVFEGLCKGYYSCKALLQLEIIQNLVLNYKSYPVSLNNLKERERIYSAIAALWVNGDTPDSLDTILSPMTLYIQSTIESQSISDSAYLFRELKGICASLTKQSLYQEFFEWLNEDKFQFIFTILNSNPYKDSYINSLFGFLIELTHNRNSRIKFDPACAYGIILFKTIGSVLISYGKILLETPLGDEPYRAIYSKIKRMLKIMRNLLFGGYVNFGIFEIYGDTCFIDSLKITFSLIGKIPRNEILVSAK